MKKSLVTKWPVVVLLLLLVAACGKEKSVEEDLSQYYIKCKIDGTAKTFNNNAFGSKADLGDGSTSYDVFGNAANNPSSFENLGFSIRSSIPITPGKTYTETDPTSDYGIGCLYNSGASDGSGLFLTDRDNTDVPFQITFTSMTNTEFAGTFSGKLFLNGSDSSVIVTEGSFKVKIQ